MITLCYPSSIWGTTPAPILFHCLIYHTPYNHPVLPLFAIAPATSPAPILFHCPISHTPYDNPVLPLLDMGHYACPCFVPQPHLAHSLSMITLCYPSSIWGTTPALILFHCLIYHTPYFHP